MAVLNFAQLNIKPGRHADAIKACAEGKRIVEKYGGRNCRMFATVGGGRDSNQLLMIWEVADMATWGSTTPCSPARNSRS
jgi:hypothetical protein